MFKEKLVVTSVRLALGILAGTSLMAGNARAQEATAIPPEKVQRVEITGSNIKSVETETASPIQVIKRSDIARQGVTSVADLINNISAATNGVASNASLSDINGSNSFASGGTNVSLRNLGAQSTLILVNGRRIASYALANYNDVFTNVDAIPLDAIERVEILKTGASAIYGSDAVAGVINIITRKNFQGVEVSADRTQSLQSGTFGTTKASITGGFGDEQKDGYNVLWNADFYRRENVMWTNLLQYTNPDLTKTSKSFGTYSSYSYPGNIIDGASTQPVAGCAPALIIGGLCKYNRYDRFQAIPASDRSNLFTSGTYNLGGGTQAFGEASYSKITTKYVNAFPIYGDGQSPVQWGNPTTGMPLTFNYLGLAANSPLNPTGDDGVGFRYRFADAPSNQDVDSSQYRVLGGLRGTFKEYEWETAVGLMGSKTSAMQQGSLSSSGFIKTIGDYNSFRLNNNPDVNLSYTANDPNFFNQPNGYHPGQVNSAAVLNTLFPVFGYSGKDSQAFADAKISGPLFNMPAGTVNFALGGELRHESYTISPSANLLAGDIIGNGISSSDASRNTAALFTELSIPILKNLEAQVAVRADKYPNLTTHFSPKLALRYTPSDSLLLRTTYESGFRAPNMVESANSLKFAFDPGTSDPLRCPQATNLSNDLLTKAANLAPNDPQVAILTARAEAVSAAECSFGLADEVKNNPDLKPETSKSFSLGLVFEPVKGYSASVDYWQINRKNTIGLASTAQLLSGGPLPAGTTLNRAPFNPQADQTFSAAEIAQYGVTSGALQNVIRNLQNISEQKTSGIDVGFMAMTNWSNVGKVTARLDGTYLLTTKDSSISDITENLAGQYGNPHFTANFTVSLENAGFSNSLRLNYIGGYALQLGSSDVTWNQDGCAANKFTADQCRVKYQQTVDYYFAYTGVKNLTIGVNVLNVFNQRQSADLRAFGVGGIIPTSLQDAQGRMLRLSAQYKFK